MARGLILQAQAEPPNRYWLSINNGDTWSQVSEDEWCDVEAQCGFRGGRPATAGFSSGVIRGHMHYGGPNPDCDYGPCGQS